MGWYLRIVSFVAFVAVAVCSYAYVLPAKQLLAFVSDRVGQEGTLVVLQKTVLYDPTLDGGMQELEETLYFKSPGWFRAEVGTSGFKKVHIVGPESALTIIGGKIMGETERLFDHFKDPFVYNKPDDLADALTRIGVDLDTVALGRFREKIAFIIGSELSDESVPQVWVDKESFYPIRFVFGGEDGSPVREVEYAEYREVAKGKRYPARILFYEDGDLVRMQVLESFEINAQISDDLFDMAYLKRMHEPVTPPPPSSELDEVKKSIQDFRKVYE